MEIGRETASVQGADEFGAITRRVGAVLIAVGLLDIGVMIYCLANGQSYSSSLNIFAVIAGVLVRKGHLGAVRVVSWFSAFLFTGFALGFVALAPWTRPLDYELTFARHHPIVTLLGVAFILSVISALLWTYQQLRSPAVLAKRVEAGYSSKPPKSAFIAATCIALFVTVMFQFTMHGGRGQHAKQLAEQKYGSQYKYFVTQINWSGNHTSALLTAYNGNEERVVRPEWDQ